MRKTNVIVFIAILLPILFFTEYTCSTLRTSRFQSLEEKTAIDRLPMSDTEPTLSHPYRTIISFRDGQFTQQESDTFFSGPYVCRFGTVVAHPSSGGTIAGIYNPFSGTLLWGGERYQQTKLEP